MREDIFIPGEESDNSGKKRKMDEEGTMDKECMKAIEEMEDDFEDIMDGDYSYLINNDRYS